MPAPVKATMRLASCSSALSCSISSRVAEDMGEFYIVVLSEAKDLVSPERSAARKQDASLRSA